MSLRGGSEYGLGLFVSAVVEGGPADLGGLSRGDRLVCIAGAETAGMSHAAAVEILVAIKGIVHLEIERGGEAIPSGKRFRLASVWRQREESRKGLKRQKRRKVVIRCSHVGEPLGMGLRGGAEIGAFGIFVSAVSGGKLAAEAGISPGERIVAIGGTVLRPDAKLRQVTALLAAAGTTVSLTVEAPAPVLTKTGAAAVMGDTSVPQASDVFDQIAFGGVVLRKPSRRRPDSIRASTYLDDAGAIPTELMVDRSPLAGAGAAAANDPTGELDVSDVYLAGRELVTVTLDPRTGQIGLEIEGGCDADEPDLGVRVVGLRENGAAFAVLQHDDEILGIGGVGLVGRSHEQCIKLFVTAITKENPFDLTVARAGAEDIASALGQLDLLDSHLGRTASRHNRGSARSRPTANSVASAAEGDDGDSDEDSVEEV